MTRIAYFTPLNPQPTGVSDYSEALIPYLAHQVEVDVFADESVAAAWRDSNALRVFAHTEFARRRRERPHDALVYQMGNSPFHRHEYAWLMRFPGVTVLHDLVLHHFHRERTLEYGDTAGYARELAYSGGAAGARLAEEAMGGRSPYPLYTMPLFERVVDASRVVVVHSAHAARQILAVRPQATVLHAPLFCDPRALVADPLRTARLREQWQIGPEAFVVAAFGRLDAQKRLETLLHALSRLRESVPTAVCLLVGEPVPLFDLRGLIAQSGVGSHVRLTGRLPLDDFYASFDLADVAVNLRDPTAGESSAVAIQLLGRGVPLVVSDAGSYAELPDDVAIKAATGRLELEQLTHALTILAAQPALRAALRKSARRYAADYHRPEHTAAVYFAAIDGARRRTDGR
ncbi:MAG: glycosyltransferase [Chloroflexi bacterium]|nr:glycosyltransferase [Chloroflexota bacterium]